jgi:hypothetical protein
MNSWEFSLLLSSSIALCARIPELRIQINEQFCWQIVNDLNDWRMTIIALQVDRSRVHFVVQHTCSGSMKQTGDSNCKNIDGSRGQTTDRSDEQCVFFCFDFLCKHVQLNAILVRSAILFEWTVETQVPENERFSRDIYFILCIRGSSGKLQKCAAFWTNVEMSSTK